MSRKKKTSKKATVQATLGEMVDKRKKPKATKQKKPAKKKASTKKPVKKMEKEKPKAATAVISEPPLKNLPGVGKKLEERLTKSGYGLVSKISRSRAKNLSKKVNGLSEAGAKKIIAAAKLLMKSEEPEKQPKPSRLLKKEPTKKKLEAAPKKEEKPKVEPITGPPLKSLPGVGKKLEERLLAAKYASVDQISRARSKSMAKKVNGLSESGARMLIKSAKEILKSYRAPEEPKAEVKEEEPSLTEITISDLKLTDVTGIGSKLADRLRSSGYDSVERLARSRPSTVSRMITGLNIDRAESIVAAAQNLVRTAQLRRFEEQMAPKTLVKDTKPKKPSKKRVKKVTEKAPEPEKAEPEKPTPKKMAREAPEPSAKVHPKPKKKKSGLPVPTAVTSLTKQLKKKWSGAVKKKLSEEEEPKLQETVEVAALTSDETSDAIVEVAFEVLNETLTTGRPAFEIPSRSSDNIVWDEIRDLLLLGMRTISRPYHSLGSVVDATRTARVMEIVFQLLQANLHATKREVFYSDVNLFRDQKYSDKIVEDVAAMLHTTRDSIHVVASARGSAMGRVVIRDGGDLIDLTRMGTGGWAITPFLDQVEIVESDAEFIILSEKDAAVMRLAEAKYWNRQPCIVLTGKGSGDIATRAFLRTLVKELEIPAFALVDSDPYGHYIYSVFLRGSKRLSYESPFIATPELKLLGVLSRDLDAYNIPKAVRIPMEPTDIKRVRDMLKEPFVKTNKEWVQDLQLMLKLREKAEIQAFASHSFQYLTDEYLPAKLETGDWI